MSDERGGKDLRDPFDIFGGFGNFGGFGGSIFGRNPFDDPFFTRPFGSMFGQNRRLGDSLSVASPRGPVIQELNSDDDDNDGDVEGQEMETEGERNQRDEIPLDEPFIDHPDDETDENTRNSGYMTDYNRVEGTQAQTYKVHSSKVTYGGVDGVYYSSSATRRMGSDGVMMEECKEADKRTGEATHRISRGLHDKGHSVSRKLNPDGKVDTLQTLHNLNEDELGNFEETWKGNTGRHSPHWTGDSGMDRMPKWGGLLPSAPHMGDDWGRQRSNLENAADSSSGRARKVVRIPID